MVLFQMWNSLKNFLQSFEVGVTRNYRWMRGDWQLLPWILGRSGRALTVVGRWKMLDNLRRSLSAPMTFILLVLVLTIPGLNILPWLFLCLASLSVPFLLPAFFDVFQYQKKVPFMKQLRSLGDDIVLAAGHFLINIFFLPYLALVSFDAIVRTLFRLIISKRKLLEWVTSAQAKSSHRLDLKSSFSNMIYSEVLVVILSLVIYYINSERFLLALPFLICWLLAPILSWKISLPPIVTKIDLAIDDILVLRNTARRIWLFFATFVTKEESYLPPDNFQEDPNPIVAHRSSPTNFGLYLLSTVAAKDFGWIGILEMVERLESSLKSMHALPRHEGHFYNWYRTTDAQALDPKYISSVDNGNLAGHLLTIAQACEEYLLSTDIPSKMFNGVLDGLQLLKKVDDSPAIKELELLLKIPFENVSDKLLHIELLLKNAGLLIKHAKSSHNHNEKIIYAELIEAEILGIAKDFYLLTPWAVYPDVVKSFKSLTLEQLIPEYKIMIANLLQSKIKDNDVLLEILQTSLHATEVTVSKIKTLASLSRKIVQEMDFSLLFDQTKKLFSIGYRVADNVLDNSYYDLLASEARLLSFVAIAKGDVPAKHWFQLGRALTTTESGTVLMSWSGSMFEYLMPSLVMRTPETSLLDQTCRHMVKNQIAYGTERSVPWGISESAYYTRDLHHTYQYSNFGLPGLGLKRGLDKDLVIAPYATILAAMYDPINAVKNLRRLTSIKVEGIYGYYEAIDFTKTRLPKGRNSMIVKTYMAHHHGMSLISISNILHHEKMRSRFHGEPIVKATELLLQEQTPRNITMKNKNIEFVEIKHTHETDVNSERHYFSPRHSVPRTNLLANNLLSVMLTAAGAGYCRFKNLAVTRWREDVTRDNYGSFIYLKDLQTNKIWSATFQPTCVEADYYEAIFSEDRTKFIRADSGITSHLEIIVSAEDNGEMRRLTLTNTGKDVRHIEVTSYAEIVLNTQSADEAHPTFSNLSIQTEFVQKNSAILATRRRRTPEESEIWLAHIITTDSHAFGDIEYETDRASFIGRNNSIRSPVSINRDVSLSNTIGNVLDPIFSLRTKVRIDPGTTAQVTFSTIMGIDRDEIINLSDKFNTSHFFDQASGLAWTNAQIKMH